MSIEATGVKTEDEILEYTQEIRTKVVNSLTKNGETMPQEPEQQNILLKTLDGMDRAALGKKKIANDKDMGNKNAAVAGMIAKLFMHGKELGQPMVSETPVSRDRPVLPTNVPDPVLVPGEVSTSHENETFNGFTSRMGQSQDG